MDYIKATNNRALQDPQGSRYGMSTQYCISDYLVGPATPCYLSVYQFGVIPVMSLDYLYKVKYLDNKKSA